MQSICRMLLKAYMLGGDYQYLFFFFCPRPTPMYPPSYMEPGMG